MSIVNPSILPGFIELLPEEQKLFDSMKNTIEKNFIKYGFVNLDTPVIEKQEILLSKGGGETSKQIYRIDKESTPQALRFDLTVSLARYVAMHAHELTFPFRRYQIGKVYRGERNQKGRFREFYQCDIDIIGNEKLSLMNDAEIPAIIYNIFNDIGFSEITFHMNNRKLLNGFFESIGIEKYEVCLRAIDKILKIGKDNVANELLKEGIKEDQIEQIFDFIEPLSNVEILKRLEATRTESLIFREGIKELKDVYDFMQKFGIKEENIKIDLSIIRGLDYYTGTVFETFLNGYESIGSVCSGGRYEDLASNFTKQKFPGIGLSIGLSRLFYQLNESGLLGKQISDVKNNVVVIPMSDEEHDFAIEVVGELRKSNIPSLVYFEGGKMKKKFQYADKSNCKFVVIIGEEEKRERKVSVKNLETGNQEAVKIEQLLDYIGG
ncbi:MAG: histidine--tRNA ligase [Tissierellia bacterium]|nr:histidine--tRNA ligase [Tissierellia bacterium]